MDRFFVVPGGMEKIINYVKNRYHNMPMYVTENGEETNKLYIHVSYYFALHNLYRTSIVAMYASCTYLCLLGCISFE